jgi:hypothetical protein
MGVIRGGVIRPRGDPFPVCVYHNYTCLSVGVSAWVGPLPPPQLSANKTRSENPQVPVAA